MSASDLTTVSPQDDTFAPHAKIVHIDIDPTSIRKNVAVAVPVVGDCKLSLDLLNEMLDSVDLGDVKADRRPWLEKIANWKSTQPWPTNRTKISLNRSSSSKSFSRLTGGDAIITTEVGQNQMWAAQYYHFDQPNHFISSGGLGTMGFGLPLPSALRLPFRTNWWWTWPATAASK